VTDDGSTQRDPDTAFRGITIVVIVVGVLIALPLLLLLLGFLGFGVHGHDPL
jgi:hypothetical protein